MSEIYIDGQFGTAGLLLSSLVEAAPHLRLLSIAHEKRKDWPSRLEKMKAADLVVLCLPPHVSQEVIAEISPDIRVIDCSPAHRCGENWTYGLPELCESQRDEIRQANRVSNAGCFATAWLLLIRPLIDMGIIDRQQPLSATGITGYSAGGKKMIQRYENEGKVSGTIVHGLDLQHKHLPEMKKYSGLDASLTFLPVVADHREGLLLSVILPTHVEATQILDAYHARYADEPFVQIHKLAQCSLRVAYPARNIVDLFVKQQEEQIVVFAHMNNLMKGAAGTALQNVNLMLGHDECIGLM